MEGGEKRRYNRIRNLKTGQGDSSVDTNEENGRKFTLERFLSDVETHFLPAPDSVVRVETPRSPKNITTKPPKTNQKTTRGIFENALLGRTTMKDHSLSPNNLARFQENIAALANGESDCNFFNDLEEKEDNDRDQQVLFPTEMNEIVCPSVTGRPVDIEEKPLQELRNSRNSSVNFGLDEVRNNNLANHIQGSSSKDVHADGDTKKVPDDREETCKVVKNLLEMLNKLNDKNQSSPQAGDFQFSPEISRNRNLSRFKPPTGAQRTSSEDPCNAFPWIRTNSPNHFQDDGFSFFSDAVPQHENLLPEPKTRQIEECREFPTFLSSPCEVAPRCKLPLRAEYVPQTVPVMPSLQSGNSYFLLPWTEGRYGQRSRNHRRYKTCDLSRSTSKNNMKDWSFSSAEKDLRRGTRTIDPSTSPLMSRMRYNRCFDPSPSPQKY